VLSESAVGKLHFVHRVMHEMGHDEQPSGALPEQQALNA
jgi:hypothetical protein